MDILKGLITTTLIGLSLGLSIGIGNEAGKKVGKEMVDIIDNKLNKNKESE